MLFQTDDTLVSISRKLTIADALENHSLEAERPACAFGGSAAPSDDAKTNAALPPELALSKGLLGPTLHARGCATFSMDGPEEPREGALASGFGLFAPAPANRVGGRDDCYHPVSNSLLESTFIVANASPIMRTRSGYPMRQDLPLGDQRY
jgi:hypothetical protein